MGLFTTSENDIQKWFEKKDIKKLSKALDNDKYYIKNSAIDFLKKLDSPLAEEALIKAMDNPDFTLRKNAINGITEQNVLIKFAKNDKSFEVRKRAVENITDENILIEIAKNVSENEEVRKTAISKINDNSILANIAITENDEKNGVGVCAVTKIEKGEFLLQEIAVKAKLCTTRMKAYTKLGKENTHIALADAAKHDKSIDNCLNALNKIENWDQNILNDIAKEAENPLVRFHAILSVENLFNLSDNIITVLIEIRHNQYYEYHFNIIINNHKNFPNSILILMLMFLIEEHRGSIFENGEVQRNMYLNKSTEIKGKIIELTKKRTSQNPIEDEDLFDLCRKIFKSVKDEAIANELIKQVNNLFICYILWDAIDQSTANSGDASNFLSRFYRVINQWPNKYLQNPAILQPLKKILFDSDQQILPERFRLAVPEIIRKVNLPESNVLLLDALKIDFYNSENYKKYPQDSFPIRAEIAKELAYMHVLESQNDIEKLVCEIFTHFKKIQNTKDYIEAKNKYYEYYSYYVVATESLATFNKVKSTLYAIELLDNIVIANYFYQVIIEALKNNISEFENEVLHKIISIENNRIGRVETGQYAEHCDGDGYKWNSPLYKEINLDILTLRKLARNELSHRGVKLKK
jgi:hypothetical protein